MSWTVDKCFGIVDPRPCTFSDDRPSWWRQRCYEPEDSHSWQIVPSDSSFSEIKDKALNAATWPLRLYLLLLIYYFLYSLWNSSGFLQRGMPFFRWIRSIVVLFYWLVSGAYALDDAVVPLFPELPPLKDLLGDAVIMPLGGGRSSTTAPTKRGKVIIRPGVTTIDALQLEGFYRHPTLRVTAPTSEWHAGRVLKADTRYGPVLRCLYRDNEEHYGLRSLHHSGLHGWKADHCKEALRSQAIWTTLYERALIFVTRARAECAKLAPASRIRVVACSPNRELKEVALGETEFFQFEIVISPTPVKGHARRCQWVVGDKEFTERDLAGMRLLALAANPASCTMFITNNEVAMEDLSFTLSLARAKPGRLASSARYCTGFSLALAGYHGVLPANRFVAIAQTLSASTNVYGLDEIAACQLPLTIARRPFPIHTLDGAAGENDCPADIQELSNSTGSWQFFERKSLSQMSEWVCLEVLDNALLANLVGFLGASKLAPPRSTHFNSVSEICLGAGAKPPPLAFTSRHLLDLDGVPYQDPATRYRHTEDNEGFRGAHFTRSLYGCKHPFEAGYLNTEVVPHVEKLLSTIVGSIGQQVTDFERANDFRLRRCVVACLSNDSCHLVDKAVKQILNGDCGADSAIFFVERDFPWCSVAHKNICFIQVPILNRAQRSLMYWRLLPAFVGFQMTQFAMANIKEDGLSMTGLASKAWIPGLSFYCHNNHGCMPVFNGASFYMGSVIRVYYLRYLGLLKHFSAFYGPDELFMLQFNPILMTNIQPSLIDIHPGASQELPFCYAKIGSGATTKLASLTQIDAWERQKWKDALTGVTKPQHCAFVAPNPVLPAAKFTLSEWHLPSGERTLDEWAELCDNDLYGFDQGTHNEQMIHVVSFGTKGDVAPCQGLVEIAQRAGVTAQLLQSNTPEEGRELLALVERNQGWQVIGITGRVRSLIRSIEGYKVAPKFLAALSDLALDFMPEPWEVKPMKAGLGSKFADAIPGIQSLIPSSAWRIKTLPDVENLPRYLGRGLKLRGPSFTWFSEGAVELLGSSSLPSTGLPPAKPGNHLETLKGVASAVFHGGHGTAEVLVNRVRKVTVITKDNDILDRRWINPSRPGAGPSIAPPDVNVLTFLALQSPQAKLAARAWRGRWTTLDELLANKLLSWGAFTVLLNVAFLSRGLLMIPASASLTESLARWVIPSPHWLFGHLLYPTLAASFHYAAVELNFEYHELLGRALKLSWFLLMANPGTVVTLIVDGPFFWLVQCFASQVLSHAFELTFNVAMFCWLAHKDGKDKNALELPWQPFVRGVPGTWGLGWHIGVINRNTFERFEFQTYQVGDVGFAASWENGSGEDSRDIYLPFYISDRQFRKPNTTRAYRYSPILNCQTMLISQLRRTSTTQHAWFFWGLVVLGAFTSGTMVLACACAWLVLPALEGTNFLFVSERASALPLLWTQAQALFSSADLQRLLSL